MKTALDENFESASSCGAPSAHQRVHLARSLDAARVANDATVSFHTGRDFEAGRTGCPRGEESPLGQGPPSPLGTGDRSPARGRLTMAEKLLQGRDGDLRGRPGHCRRPSVGLPARRGGPARQGGRAPVAILLNSIHTRSGVGLNHVRTDFMKSETGGLKFHEIS